MCAFGIALQQALDEFVAKGEPFDIVSVKNRTREIAGREINIPWLSLKGETLTLLERGAAPGFKLVTKEIPGVPHTVWEIRPDVPLVIRGETSSPESYAERGFWKRLFG